MVCSFPVLLDALFTFLSAFIFSVFFSFMSSNAFMLIYSAFLVSSTLLYVLFPSWRVNSGLYCNLILTWEFNLSSIVRIWTTFRVDWVLTFSCFSDLHCYSHQVLSSPLLFFFHCTEFKIIKRLPDESKRTVLLFEGFSLPRWVRQCICFSAQLKRGYAMLQSKNNAQNGLRISTHPILLLLT